MTLEEAIKQYEEYDMAYHVFRVGGYPAAINTLNGVIAIAQDSDNKGVDLDLYTIDAFIAWMDVAKELSKMDGCDLGDAIIETQKE